MTPLRYLCNNAIFNRAHFEPAKERFHGGVVVAITFGAHAGFDALL